VSGIDIGTQVLAPTGTDITKAGPGVPVDLDITVHGKDGDADPSNDPVLGDVPVEISVDKGFLSPDAESVDDLKLASDHAQAGDQWGYFQNDGTDKTVTTADSGSAEGTAGAVAAIEKDAGFDDDGLTDVTVTVKAGGVTETKTITYDARALLNAGDASFERAQGEPSGDVPTSESLDFQLYLHDQCWSAATVTPASTRARPCASTPTRSTGSPRPSRRSRRRSTPSSPVPTSAVVPTSSPSRRPRRRTGRR